MKISTISELSFKSNYLSVKKDNSLGRTNINNKSKIIDGEVCLEDGSYLHFEPDLFQSGLNFFASGSIADEVIPSSLAIRGLVIESEDIKENPDWHKSRQGVVKALKASAKRIIPAHILREIEIEDRLERIRKQVELECKLSTRKLALKNQQQLSMNTSAQSEDEI